ncbi:MAG TPA: amino acid ABC transporter permease [Spirochaetia bacterium]|nr:amino acid ABC transporter permease [Spirochaetales bacterium]HRW23480.1 amino acid ABC transporter permease [Spirochaetia bacterium]
MDRPFNPGYIIEVLPRLLAFLPVTLGVAAATALLGTLLGFVLAKAKLGRSAVARGLADAYTWVLRCTPSIVLLFLVYYGLPAVAKAAFGVDVSLRHRAFYVVLTFTLFFAATMSELMRSAYLAVDRGQREAALSHGLSEFQAFRRIVLPQAAVSALPNVATSLVALLKEGSLAYTVGLVDLMGQGTLIIARGFGAWSLETYLAAALIYWALTVAIEKAAGALERRLSVGRRGLA